MGDLVDIQHQRSSGSISCLAFTPIDRRGSLVGFADLHILGYRIRLFSCTVHEQNGKRWVGLPGRPWVNSNGELVRDETTGKVKYQPVLAFDSKDILDRFSVAAITAIKSYDVGAFR